MSCRIFTLQYKTLWCERCCDFMLQIELNRFQCICCCCWICSSVSFCTLIFILRKSKGGKCGKQQLNIVLVLCSLWDKPKFILSLHPGLHQMFISGTHSQFASHDRLEKDKGSSACASYVMCCLQANCGLFGHSQRPSDDAPHDIQVCLNQTVIFALHMVKSQWSMRFPEREM